MTDSVALVKYDGDLRKNLEEAVNLTNGLATLISPLIIKPNLCTEYDRTGYANTNVEIVITFIKLVLEKKKNTSVRIVEADSGGKNADAAFKKFGYTALEQQFKTSGFDVSLVNLSHSHTTMVNFDGLYFQNPELPSILVEAKFFVSIAVPKTHGLTSITGVSKNLFGLLPKKNKSVYHPHINEVIVDLNRLVRPDLCIVDARVGLEGWNGPRQRNLNALILGSTPVSVDATMSRVMGFNPRMIRHLVEAEKYNCGDLSPNVIGETIESRMINFHPS